MSPAPRHRPERVFPEARRIVLECTFEVCVHCQACLLPRKGWYMRKYVQTLNGPWFVAGRGKLCGNPACSHPGTRYYASQALSISLPFSTYGLDVLAFIGWQHEKEHQQLAEIQRALTERTLLISERTVGRLYRQFLALLGGMTEKIRQRLTATAQQHGGLIWAVDALQPEGHGSLLYLLYEVLSETPVRAIQLNHPTAAQLSTWLGPYRDLCAQELSCAVLATRSDGEEAIIGALRHCWPDAPHQRCQCHFLNNLAEPVMEEDRRLRQQLPEQLGGLPAVPDRAVAPAAPAEGPQEIPGRSMSTTETPVSAAAPAPAPTNGPPFLPTPLESEPSPEVLPSGGAKVTEVKRDAELVAIEEQIRQAIRDAVNRPSRKPFHWGGLAGYRQLEALAQALDSIKKDRLDSETTYLQRLALQVHRAVENNRRAAEDLATAQDWLRRIAACLRYPPQPPSAAKFSETADTEAARSQAVPPSRGQVRSEMEELLKQFQPNLKWQPAQAALYHTWHRLWNTCGSSLLHCYDIPGLPPDNLKIEAHFGQLRNHQRRISGRQSTRPLRDFGQYQVLFNAESETDLLQQLRRVSLVGYKTHRHRLAEAETERQLLTRLHRDPVATAHRLINQHKVRRAFLAQNKARGPT